MAWPWLLQKQGRVAYIYIFLENKYWWMKRSFSHDSNVKVPLLNFSMTAKFYHVHLCIIIMSRLHSRRIESFSHHVLVSASPEDLTKRTVNSRLHEGPREWKHCPFTRSAKFKIHAKQNKQGHLLNCCHVKMALVAFLGFSQIQRPATIPAEMLGPPNRNVNIPCPHSRDNKHSLPLRPA